MFPYNVGKCEPIYKVCQHKIPKKERAVYTQHNWNALRRYTLLYNSWRWNIHRKSCVCISDHKDENSLQWILAAYTHMLQL